MLSALLIRLPPFDPVLLQAQKKEAVKGAMQGVLKEGLVQQHDLKKVEVKKAWFGVCVCLASASILIGEYLLHTSSVRKKGPLVSTDWETSMVSALEN